MKQQRAGKVIHNANALLSDLKSCRDIEHGKRLHAKIMQSHNDTNIYVLTALIKMYVHCGEMEEARSIFDKIQQPDVISWNVLLLGYAENGEGGKALEMFSRMKERGCQPNCGTHIAALKACTSLAINGYDNNQKDRCLQLGRHIHLEMGSFINDYVQTSLIDMYSKCGSMVDAVRVFEGIQKPNVVSWTALLRGYADNGDGLTALDVFLKMKASGCVSDGVTYVAALKACISLALNGGKEDCLELGREIHSEARSHLDQHVQSTLVDMYAKCGCMVEARCVFDAIKNPNVVSWTALILGHAENGEGHIALDLFSEMKSRGCKPNYVTYVAALKACTYMAAVTESLEKEEFLELGRKIHSEIRSDVSINVKNTLIDMYANYGGMTDARSIFYSIDKPNVVSWTALIMGYAENGEGQIALDLLSKMKENGCIPDSVTYVAALKACGLIGALAVGRRFHSNITDFTAHIITCLIDFYAKCGSMVEAQEVFDFHSRMRGISTWNALLAGYGILVDTESVFNLFEAMQDEGCRPDSITFVSILLCCSHGGLVEKAKEYFEAMLVKFGITPSVLHYTCMVDTFGRANLLDEAIGVLQEMPCKPDTVTSTTLLGACRKWNNVEIARLVFQNMVHKDALTYTLMAQICGDRGMWQEQTWLLEKLGMSVEPKSKD